MAKYTVNVDYHTKNNKDINVYAACEDEAEEKAIHIVEGWTNVVDADAVSISEG